MIFTRLARKNNAASTLALAVSIAAGGMVAASAFEAPAFAQKEKKSQPKYSKAFIEAYKPLETMASAEPVYHRGPSRCWAGTGVMYSPASPDNRQFCEI